MVMAPAICLLVTGILGVLVDLFQIFMALLIPPPPPDPNLGEFWNEMMRSAHGPQAAIGGVIFAVVSLIIVIASIKKMSLSGWGLAMTGSILAMVNIGNCCCLLGLPFGIWSLVVLSKEEVKANFN